MAPNNNNPYTFFTITQPFLGAPLQFYPALGSPEFEYLIDCYVTGSASKQDKLSQVTIDFYNNATVDLNTGALTKRYEVFNVPSWAGQSFEQSPVQSQSSGFSPPIFTPSPGSSATLGDSTYGSISLTPPTRNGAGRIAKKPKKDTKKTAEARLPGFSIMTKDGVDVTSSAGRGTKTKEQREHAHLMRQLKACADCKRKKVRCDPSHRRSHNDMSRTSTSTSKTSSSSRINPSTPASTPSSRQATQNSIPSFNTSNAFNDFVLFPEDTASWNPADMSLTDFDSQDLSHFNFDVNEIDLNTFAPTTADQSFDFASPVDQQTSSSMLPNQTNYAPFMSGQYGLDQWAEPQGYSMSVNHTRPHPSGQYADSGQVNSTPDMFADIDWYSSATNHQPQSHSIITNSSLIHSSPSDWSILESSVNANISPQQGGDLGIDTPSSQSLSDRSQSSRSRPISSEFDSTGSNTNPGFQDLSPGLSPGDSGILVDPLDSPPSDLSKLLLDSSLLPDCLKQSEARIPTPAGQLDASRFDSSVQELTIAIESCQPLWYSLNECAYNAYSGLENDLQQIQTSLGQLESTDTVLSGLMLSQLETLEAKLELLTATVEHQHQLGQIAKERYNKPEPDFGPKHLRECQVLARQLVRSLCATIASLQAQESGPSPATGNRQMLTSPSVSNDREKHAYALQSYVQTPYGYQTSITGSTRSTSSASSLSTSGMNASAEVLLRERRRAETLNIVSDVDGMGPSTSNQLHAVVTSLLSVQDVPRYSLLLKTASTPFEATRMPWEIQTGYHHSTQSLSLDQSASAQELFQEQPKSQLAVGGDHNHDEQVTNDLERNPNHVRPSEQPSTTSVPDVLEEGRNSQLVCSLACVTPPTVADDQPAHYVASHPEAVDVKVHASSRVAIPRTTVADVSSHSSALVQQSIFSNGLVWRYILLAALPIIATLIVSSFALAFAATAAIYEHKSPIFLLALLAHGIESPRVGCISWVGSNSLISVGKLVLCATFAAKVPEILEQSTGSFTTESGMTVLTLLCGSDFFGKASGNTSTRKSGMKKIGNSSWLGMLEHLSPVTAVL